MSSKIDLETYIDNIEYSSDRVKDIITVEHRLNNKKRDFLFVDRVQGKHIPVEPHKVDELVSELACKVSSCIPGHHSVLVIGFCETATALGEILASKISCCDYYMQTTREQIDQEKLFNFSEEHSHATEQLVYVNPEDKEEYHMKTFDTIVFVDDEISTGKTIVNFVNALKQHDLVKDDVKYIVASICNWQDDKNKQLFIENNITGVSLIQGQLKDASVKMNVESVVDGETDLYDSVDELCVAKDHETADHETEIENHEIVIDDVPFNLFLYNRCGHACEDDWSVSNYFANLTFEAIMQDLSKSGIDKQSAEKLKIDIIGTEEFMHVPIITGEALERVTKDVTFHATTRSPIDICRESIELNNNDIKKGIMHRYKIHSAYDKDRVNYIYNLYKADRVYVITDSLDVTDRFKQDIIQAVKLAGCSEVKIISFKPDNVQDKDSIQNKDSVQEED